MEILQFLFANFGKTLTLLITLLIMGFLFVALIYGWIVLHRSARIGTKISFLWNFVTYTKGQHRPLFRRDFRSIEVTDEFEMLWRIKKPPAEWIELDIGRVHSEYIEELLLGPFHSICKSNLSNLDRSDSMRGSAYFISRGCNECGVDLIPGSGPLDRYEAKEYLFKRLQQAHLSGKKIKSGMRI